MEKQESVGQGRCSQFALQETGTEAGATGFRRTSPNSVGPRSLPASSTRELGTTGSTTQRFHCGETQAHVVSGPVPCGIAQLGTQCLAHLVYEGAALSGGEHRAETLGDRPQPARDVPGQRRRPRDERDVTNHEAARFQAAAVVFGGREVPRGGGGAVDAAPSQSGPPCSLDPL